MVPTHPIVTFTLDRMRERAAVKARRGTQKRDFLTRAIEAQAKYPDIVTDKLIVLYSADNVAAGSDTTAIALRAVRHRFANPEGPLLTVEVDLLLPIEVSGMHAEACRRD